MLVLFRRMQHAQQLVHRALHATLDVALSWSPAGRSGEQGNVEGVYKQPAYHITCLNLNNHLRHALLRQETMDIHWGKHHATYVTNLNKQIANKDLDSKSLEEASLWVPAVWRDE